MRINIAASHRFHLLDLARELQNLGHDVKFYSYVPKKRVATFGLKSVNIRSLFIPMLPFLALVRVTKGAYFPLKLLNLTLDFAMAWFMRPCDVYIALGTVYKNSFVIAKRKFGATTIMEWGSKHIDEQRRILEDKPGTKRQNPYFSERAKQGYTVVDYISVASGHVRKSFEERGFSSDRILQNPYGVELSMFGPTTLTEEPFDVLMVGGWSYRKGCDLLVDACRTNKWTLLHVGSIVDLPFPVDQCMTHIDSVNQKDLKKYYARARVFVLPSREEGLAMVQLQAIACGLPLVCSRNTGGRDLRAHLNNDKWIIEIEEDTATVLAEGIATALELAQTQEGARNYCKSEASNYSWEEYGRRYERNLLAIGNAAKHCD